MFGIYARNIVNGQGRYISYEEESIIKKQKKDRFREGKKLYGCCCKSGSCNSNRLCHYTNEQYWNNDSNSYLPLTEFLFGKLK